MKKRKGFTLIELMVVVLIIAVLAAIIVPMMTSRINSAKWSEARAAMGQIATALRAYVAENETTTTTIVGTPGLNFKSHELDGKYFLTGNYSITNPSYDTTTGTMSYTITADTTVGGTQTGAPTGGPLIMTCNANVTTWNF